MKNWVAYALLSVLLRLSCGNPVLVIEVAKEGLTTPKTTAIAQHEGIQLTEYNDTLSEYGRQQQYLIGLEMRVRYNTSIFGGECNPLDIFAYAVSKESVMLSGQVHLFGICPLFSNHNITPDLVEKSYPPFDFPGKKQIGEELGLYATPYNFMPLPLHSTYHDPIFGAEESDQYPIPASDLPGSKEEAALDDKFRGSLYKGLGLLSGESNLEMTASRIYDTVQELLSLGTRKLLDHPQLMTEAQQFIPQYFQSYWTEANKKKYAVMFFRELLVKLQNAVINKLNPLLATPLKPTITIEQPDYDYKKLKYYLYEISDPQIYTYLDLMQVIHNDYIPPSSVLIFELHQTCDLHKDMSLHDAMLCFDLLAKYNDVDMKSRFCESPCKVLSFSEKVKEYFGDLIKA